MGTLKNECNAKAYNHERTNKRITKFMYSYVNSVFAKNQFIALYFHLEIGFWVHANIIG